MLNINPQTAPFTLTPDNQVPEAIRDTEYWDDGGDVLLVTKDGTVMFLRMDMLIRYSETIRGLLNHIAGVPQEGLWTPILELQCSATELRAVLEYLRLQEQGIQPSVDSLARCALSAYTLGIQTLDDAALTGLLACARDRMDTYTNWEGITEIRPPPLNPEHAVLASRALPEPASSILAITFIDLSVFTPSKAASYPSSEALALRGPNDEDTIILLRERHSELVDSLLKLSRNFGRRRSLAKVGRPCCNFEAFAVDHTHNLHVNAAMKGRSALSIITAAGAALETARSREASAPKDFKQEDQHLSDYKGHSNSPCSSCLTELHLEMMRLYSLWLEDMGRLLMGEPQTNHFSVWDNIRDRLRNSQTPVLRTKLKLRQRIGCFCRRMIHAVGDLLFRRGVA
ncbi:hypothetical protein EDB92DRAFT_1186502 [Lactarius akahatsu]|uniref:Uncharacterized protein n=1 Tax=Lactarius akahatsu TaxID=416441 RepID=A0AAD4QBN3_9AGAM|nr:hypothetical protein EDB92DRAFT_1186502 [Lactarius akahatsu]